MHRESGGHRHRVPGRHLLGQIVRHRHRLIAAGGVSALLAVLGPGLLAGLSDDDPAGITTYSISETLGDKADLDDSFSEADRST